jgi:ribosome biogenesis GTPase
MFLPAWRFRYPAKSCLTTALSMFLMPGGWLLIDMPGLREVLLWADPTELAGGFDDIARLARECRFRDCSHSGEPDCAVQQAGLNGDRLANYHKMQSELGYLDRKTDKRLESENKARWKIIHKAMRNHSKLGG